MATTVNRTDTFEQWRVKTNTISTDLGTVASLNTTAKDSTVSAINELKSRTIYIGTTGIVTDRSSAAQSLTGISSIQLPGSTSGTVTIQPAAIAGTTTLTAPATSGTIVTTGDTGTVTNTMLAGSIANSKLVNSTISGVALGSNLNTLTLGDGLDGVSYNGTTGITAAVGSSIARRADTHYIGTTAVALNRASANLGLAGITSVAMPGSTSGTITLQPAAIAGTTTLTLPSGTGTILSDQSAISGSQLVAGSVANAKLASSSLTVGTTTISLGSSSTTLAGLTSVTSTSFVGALTGNSSSATVLQNARTINGVSFDGSANITVTAATPNALTVGTGVVLNSGTTFDGSAAKTVSVDSTVVALKADTHYIGTTAVTLNRASANLGLTGISSITLPGSSSGTVQLVPVAAVGTGTVLTIPAVTGTIVTTGDTGSVTNTMLAGSIANAKLVNSAITIAGTSTSLGGSITQDTITGLSATGIIKRTAANTLAIATAGTDYVAPGGSITGSAGSVANALTIGTGLSGTSYNGSAAVTIANTGVLSLTGTSNQVSVSASTGNITLSLPQSIGTSSTPTFAGQTLTGAVAQNVNIASASTSNVYTLTNSNANYSGNPTRFVIDSAGNVTITGNLSVSGTTTITATNYAPDWGVITNKQYYGQIKDGTTTAIAATNISNGDAIWYRGSNGVTVTVGSNDATYGDNVLISLSAVPNSSLANSSITVGTTAIALGASSTTLAGLTSVSSTTFTGALTGNASTATTLQTARAINGVSFNGSADITITANTTNALTIGTGLSGTSFNGSSNITIANTGVLDLTAGGAISITGTKTNYTVAHTDTSSVADLTVATNTFISGQTYDTYGHVLTRTTGTVDFTVAANYGFANVAVTTDTGYTWGTINAATTQAAESNTDTITLVPGSTAGVAGIDIQGSTVGATDALRIAHSDTSTLSGAYGTNGISSITVDGMGHITAVSTATYLTSVTGTANQVIATPTTGAVALSLPQDIATTSAVTFGSVTTSGNIVVGGNLTVNGTTTTVNSTTLDVVDLNITVGKNATTAAAANGAGLTIGNYASNPTLLYVNTSDRMVFNRGVEGSSFVRTGGTSSQFLKADGSVDNNTYLTGNQSISISGDATGSGTTSIGLTLANSGVTAGTYNNVTVDAKGRVTAGSNVAYLTSYTETSTLANVVSRGSTTTSGITVGINNGIGLGSVQAGKSYIYQSTASGLVIKAVGGSSFGFIFEGAQGQTIFKENLNGTLGISSDGYATIFGGSITATSFVKSGGTSGQFLKADGSVDSSAYLTSYTETSTLQNVTSRGATTTTSITAASFVKSGGTSSQFLKADGSVDSSTYLTGNLPTDIVTSATISAAAATGGAEITVNYATKNVATGTVGGAGTSVNLLGGAAITVTRSSNNVTIANTGVTSVTQGTGITVSAGTGAVTITNSGVTSITAGTGITVTGTTTPSISIPQAIGTTSNVQFGSLGIGTAASGTAGEIRATDNVTAYYSSDERLKTNVTKIDNALEKVAQIDGVIYDWNDTYKQSHGDVDGYFVRDQNSGVIAQQVEKVFPNVVAERADGYKAVRYELLVPLLIEAIKDLKAEIEALKANK